MSELLQKVPGEHKLWYDGPNYTADAVILDLAVDKILLVERVDEGGWALPAGFIDPTDESSLEAARREAEEEAGVTGMSGGALFYKGKVSDPRSSSTSWIETRAHLFHHAHEAAIQAGDDAKAAAWHDLTDLPPLYGSHLMLIERALDYNESEQLFAVIDSPDSQHPVEGGYMQYDKWIAEQDGEKAFVKRSPKENPRYDELQRYIEKEAGTIAHLRHSGFKHVPAKSAIRGNEFVMEAFTPEDGWRWQMDTPKMDAYLADIFTAFSELEQVPLPPDVFNVEDSYESVLQEGWQTFTEETYETLLEKYYDSLTHLSPQSQKAARNLFTSIPDLQRKAFATPRSEELVLCHHDIRQSNLAWHPDKGARIVDWSWAGPGLPGTDSTSLLIDLYKNGYDVSAYRERVNPEHCLNMIGFWLTRSTLPNYGLDGLREQQFMSAISAYQIQTGNFRI